MCGLAGFVDFLKDTDENCLDAMIRTLEYRGPNNVSTKLIKGQSFNVGLGHARLSIIDLSKEANQPIQFKNLNIVYNGEIYNFSEIKYELIAIGHSFTTNSDTEVILHAYQEWNMKCVEKFIGMFVILIYDNKESEIIIFRDRPGVKPLYYYLSNDLFLFSSELKAIVKHPKFEQVINKEAVNYFFKFGYIPSPISIYENVNKFPAGHFAKFDLKKRRLVKTEYWNINNYYSKLNSNKLSYNEAKLEVEKLLESSIKYRNIADVPIGVFLSGGYDSTTVAAILQKNTKERIKTFTIGFNRGNNEAPFAKKIAEHLNTDHYEYYCDVHDALDAINEIPFFYDEPFGDSSAIPTILVSKKAKEKVKVVISADGGDEIFFGYDDYDNMEKYSRKIARLPNISFVNTILAYGLKLVSKLYSYSSFKNRKLLGLRDVLISNKKYKDSILFEAYSSMSDSFLKKLLKTNKNLKSNYKLDYKLFKDKMSLFIALDFRNYLQNDMLVKVDRATMSQSIEGREPLLDHRLVEYVAGLPTNYKYFKGDKKRILKDILFTYIPEELFVKKKLGFTVPIYDWLREDLSFLIDNYLSMEELKKSNLFNEKVVLKIIKDFKNDELPDETIIWKLLMFQMWYKKWMTS